MKVRILETGAVEEVIRPIVIVASSKSGSTEVLRYPNGHMVEVHHLKSGRDEVMPTDEIPDCLTVRYKEPYPWAREPREHVQR